MGDLDLDDAVAVAAWGRHPLLIRGGAEKRAAEHVGRALAQTLPPLRAAERAEIDRIRRRAARTATAGRERPTVTASAGDAVIGTTPNGEPGTAELAHHGVLTADGIETWNGQAVGELYVAAREGHARHLGSGTILACDCRIVASTTGCACREPNARCRCSVEERERAAERLRTGIEGLLFDVAADGSGEIAIDEQKVRNRLQAARKRFPKRGTRENARLNLRIRDRRWRMSAAANQRLRRISTDGRELERVLQVARSVAQLQLRGTIETADIDTGARLTAHLRAPRRA